MMSAKHADSSKLKLKNVNAMMENQRIEANELRVGNYLNHIIDGLVVVEKIDSTNFLLAKDGVTVHRKGAATCKIINNDLDSLNDTRGMWLDFLQPIKLTEEWLKKLGFLWNHAHKHPNFDELMINDFGIGNANDQYWISEILDQSPLPEVEIHYVHQLQNLYYSLTQQELPCPYLTKHATS